MTAETDKLEDLKQYFDMTDSAGMRRFFCKACNSSWQLPSENHLFVYLKLEAHGLGHILDNQTKDPWTK